MAADPFDSSARFDPPSSGRIHRIRRPLKGWAVKELQRWARSLEGRLQLEDGTEPMSVVLAVADGEAVHCDCCRRLFTRPDQVDLILDVTWTAAKSNP
jgi:hypothetical protein